MLGEGEVKRRFLLVAATVLSATAVACVPWTHTPGAGPRAPRAAEARPAPAALGDAGERPGLFAETLPALPLEIRTDPHLALLLDGARPALELALEPLPRGGTSRHRAYTFSFPSAGDNLQPGRRVSGRYFMSKRPGTKRLVLILPVYGSSTYPPYKITQRLLLGPRGAETNVLLLDGTVSLFDWPTMWNAEDPATFWSGVDATREALFATAVDVRRLLDWAATRPEVDAERLGLVGFSVGAIVGTLVMAVDDRPAAAALAMGGGDLPAMFTFCYGKAALARANVHQRFGWGEEDLEPGLARRLGPVDPIAYAPAVDPERLLWLEAGEDDCVPPEVRERLWQRLGRPERYILAAEHRRAFLAMTFLNRYFATRKIVDFLDGRLGVPGRPSRSAD